MAHCMVRGGAFDLLGNLSKCPYILPEIFVTAVTPPKKKKKGLHLFGVTFAGIFRSKVMEKVQRNRRRSFFFFFWRSPLNLALF